MGKLKYFLMIFLLISTSLHGLEKLPEKYLVSYGSKDAPIKIVQYYSFKCPHCLELFRSDFSKIQERYILNNKIYWEFHPAPMDLLTLYGMHCLSFLSENEKKVFLGVILEEIDIEDFDYSWKIMQKSMEIFGKSKAILSGAEDLVGTATFNDATTFIIQDDKLNSVPFLQVNNRNIPDQVPDLEFIEKLVDR